MRKMVVASIVEFLVFFLLKMITKSDCRVGIVLLPMPINISCKRKSSIHPLLGPS
jgi:hypothetical protein